MICPACTPGGDGPLCASCAAKVRRVKPAGRGTVNSAAIRTYRILGTRTDAEALVDWLESGRSAGRNW